MRGSFVASVTVALVVVALLATSTEGKRRGGLAKHFAMLRPMGGLFGGVVQIAGRRPTNAGRRPTNAGRRMRGRGRRMKSIARRVKKRVRRMRKRARRMKRKLRRMKRKVGRRLRRWGRKARRRRNRRRVPPPQAQAPAPVTDSPPPVTDSPIPAPTTQPPCIATPIVEICSRKCSTEPMRVCRRECRRGKRAGRFATHRCSDLCGSATQDSCIDVCVEAAGATNLCGTPGEAATQNPQPQNNDSNNDQQLEDQEQQRLLEEQRLQEEQREREKRERLERERRRRAEKGLEGCSRRTYKRELRARRRTLHKYQNAASRCGDEDKKCVDKAYRRVVHQQRRIGALKHSYVANCNLGLELHRQSKRKHKRTSKHRFHCKSKSFKRWMKKVQKRRQQLLNRSSKCGDEDAACVQLAMRQIIKLNKRVTLRRKRCHKKSSRRVRSALPVDSIHHVITESVWRHAITCEGMRAGFARWLRYMRNERQRLHDNACKCSARDVECFRERMQRIMAIQKAIRDGRTSYTELVTKCDKCAPIRLRFKRWVKLQTDRRKRLHSEICKCANTDMDCVTRRVVRIKQIQQRIKDGRKHIFHMNEHCHDDHEDSIPTSAPSVASTRASSAATLSAGLFTVLLVAIVALLM